MTVTVNTSTENLRTGTTSPQTFSHAGASSGVRGVLLAIVHGSSSTDHVSAASYGGVAMQRKVRATDTNTEAGAAEWWFLGNGASIPQGTQTVSYTPGSTTDDIHAVCITVLGDRDVAVIDTDSINENATDPSVTLNYGGRSAMAFAALYGGGTGPGVFTPNANCTTVQDEDLGNFYSEVIRQTTAGTSDFAIGGTASGDDVAYAALAVSDQPITVAVGLNTETDSALACTHSKALAVGLNTEADSALAATRVKAKVIGLSTETESALALVVPQIVAVGLAAETDSVFPATAAKVSAVGLVDETDSALAVSATKSLLLGLATSPESALAMTWSRAMAIGINEETDTVLSATTAKQKTIGLATETDEALAFSVVAVEYIVADRARRGSTRGFMRLGGR